MAACDLQNTVFASVIGHPLGCGGGGGGGGGEREGSEGGRCGVFVKDHVKVLNFLLLDGDTEQSQFPSLRGITLNNMKPW